MKKMNFNDFTIFSCHLGFLGKHLCQLSTKINPIKVKESKEIGIIYRLFACSERFGAKGELKENGDE